jgi:hypothetical protein
MRRAMGPSAGEKKKGKVRFNDEKLLHVRNPV